MKNGRPGLSRESSGTIPLSYTRTMVNAALAGALAGAEFVTDPVFGVEVPTAVPGVPTDVLQPRDAWSDGAAYDTAAAQLASMFKENFSQFADQVSDAVRKAGPR